MARWKITNVPLSDGWYWWRASCEDDEPQILQVSGGLVTARDLQAFLNAFFAYKFFK